MLAWLNIHSMYVETRDKNLACLYNIFSFSVFWEAAAKQNLFPLKESVYIIKYTHLPVTEEMVISLYRCGRPDLGINGVEIKEAF